MKWIAAAIAVAAMAQAQIPARFDTIIRGGTVVDGSGSPRYDADVGIRRGYIAAIGNLVGATADTEIDARGLIVTPGFINIHSHASPDALPMAVNMLQQGVTTEIMNADGGGAIDLAAQMTALSNAGLAVNAGAYIGFNVIWQNVNGNADRRPTPDDVQRMRGMIASGLAQGAWGVSAGLDYKPGYFAQAEEVTRIIDVARPARTNFTNHDRITPESNYSSKVGVAETIAIGERAGLVPVVTHMKSQGREQGQAGELLASMSAATRRGHYTAADAYPYLAGQSGLGSLIIPGWAQEGGREAMLRRFADPEQRARIVKEAEEAMAARFGGPQGVYLPQTQQELTAVMKEMNAGGGETVIRILEQQVDAGAILRFGSEEDLVRILQHPTTSMACDCGATTATRVHPRFYGSYPRVFGRYVRELKVLTWEDAIRKSTALPAATIGMVDRGLVAVGMAADVAAFDPATITDHATYENPALPPVGMRHVLVNGVVALKDGAATGAKGGRALLRSHNMPSRPTNSGTRRLRVRGSSSTGQRIDIDLVHRAGARQATGRFLLEAGASSIRADRLGVLQTADRWASFTSTSTGGSDLESTENASISAITVIVDLNDPASPSTAAIVVSAEGRQPLRFTLPRRAVTIDD